MKIEVSVDEKATDLKISVTCRQLTPDIEKILATLRMMNHQLTAKKDAEIYLLDTAQVIYIESVAENALFTHRMKYTNRISDYMSWNNSLKNMDSFA